jgi:signal transduction histidine kinase
MLLLGPLLCASLAGWAVALHLRLELGRRAALTARACHEVRGPLTAAGLALHAAARRGSGPAVLRAVDAELRRAAVAIEDLVEGIDRRRRGLAVERPVEDVDVPALLEDLLPSWQAVAGDVVLREPLPPVTVVADPIRLAQALGNLVGNAHEHGHGPIEVGVRAVGERVLIEVTDHGPGLPAPVAVLVAREGVGPHGHGLAVAADVAARCGGRLAAAPAADGARLMLDLPAGGMAAVVSGRSR